MRRRITSAPLLVGVLAFIVMGLPQLVGAIQVHPTPVNTSSEESASTSINTWARSVIRATQNIPSAGKPTGDGGYILTGGTAEDMWVFKLDGAGNFRWNKTYGGSSSDHSQDILLTDDGGYLVAGYTYSFGAGVWDFWLVKLDASGNLRWSKTYGGPGNEFLGSIAPTADGGYLLAGSSDSFGPQEDAWLVKVDGAGNLLWQKTYGGPGTIDVFDAITPTLDGNYVVAGWTNSFGQGVEDAWVVKLDEAGNILWQKTYGGSRKETLSSIVATPDGGYVVGGGTESFGNPRDRDIWLLKLDGGGNVVWQNRFGGIAYDNIFSNGDVAVAHGGGYIAAGFAVSFGKGLGDVLVLRLDEGGRLLWNKTYGTSNSDVPELLERTPDGGYLIGADNLGAMLLKMDSEGSISNTAARGCSLIGTTPVVAVPTTGVQSDSSVVPVDSTGVSNSVNPQVTSPDQTIQAQCGPPPAPK